MEQVMEKPLNSTSPVIQPGIAELENKKPPQNEQFDQNSQDSSKDLKKPCTPDRLKVPKAFKYTERYRSPTDSMMSPITKGILARNRKGGGGSLLPPTITQTKIHELQVQDGLSQN